MLNRCERYVDTNNAVDAVTRREKGTKAYNKVRQVHKADEKNIKAKFEKPVTGKTCYPRLHAHSDPKAYHQLNKPSSEIMRINRNDPLLVRPSQMYIQLHEQNLRHLCYHHNKHGHYTNDCRHLKMIINDNINNGYCEEFMDNSQILDSEKIKTGRSAPNTCRTKAGEGSGTKKDTSSAEEKTTSNQDGKKKARPFSP
ncbi:hypothetical protein NE237_006131 [Protea cynaroides]|uniref:Uncharacterized protein n=1 Tax=Protea cynaroides TaxID=273540 RepID=A0A9Q0QV53_9MAGN|nr:hypothetical protein NE237_006131 [Protea cynaroides]